MYNASHSPSHICELWPSSHYPSWNLWAAPPKGAYHSWAGAWRSLQRWCSESLSNSSHLYLQGDASSISAGRHNKEAHCWRQLLLQSAFIYPLTFPTLLARALCCAARAGPGSVGHLQPPPSAASFRRHQHSNGSIWPASIDVLGKPQAAGLKCRGASKPSTQPRPRINTLTMCILSMLIQRGLRGLNVLSTSWPLDKCVIKECSWASDKANHTTVIDPWSGTAAKCLSNPACVHVAPFLIFADV